MPKHGPLQSPFENPTVPTPSAGDGTLAHGGQGVSVEGGPSATANMSELPACPPTVFDQVQNAPAAGSHIDVDDKVTSPGIPFTQFGKG
jgi:hypothetical protein